MQAGVSKKQTGLKDEAEAEDEDSNSQPANQQPLLPCFSSFAKLLLSLYLLFGLRRND